MNFLIVASSDVPYMSRVKTLKSSVKEMQAAMERSNSLLTAVALKTGVTEVDGEDL